MSEARAPRLDDDIAAIRTTLARIEERLQHVATDVEVATITAALPYLASDAKVAAIETTLPFLATKAEIAKLPTRGEMWTMMAAMTGGFAVILTALTFLQHWLK